MAAVERIYLLGGQPRNRLRFRLPVASLRNRHEIHQALEQASAKSSLWIGTSLKSTDDLLRAVMSTRSKTRPGHRLGGLLLLFPPRLDSLPALEDFFEPVAWGTSNFQLLSHEELAEVLAAPNRHELLIGGFVDPQIDALVLYRGDFERLTVPLSLFKQHGNGGKPEPSQLTFADFGQTVRLGRYEAASDAILYEVDPEYRRRVNAERRAQDRSFGASLRRLRVLKGLRQSDFNSIPAKTIARIERGEVARPHRETIQKLADQLGVEADDIRSY